MYYVSACVMCACVWKQLSSEVKDGIGGLGITGGNSVQPVWVSKRPVGTEDMGTGYIEGVEWWREEQRCGK